MRTQILFMALLMACNGGSTDDPVTGDTGDTDNPDTETCPDPYGLLENPDDVCQSSEYWETQPMAGWYLLGEYTIIGDDVVGTLRQELWGNEQMADTMGTRCTVYWDVSGTVLEANGPGDYAVNLLSTVNEGKSNCGQDISGQEIYVGFEFFDDTYDIKVLEDGTSIWYNEDNSEYARGCGIGDSLTYASDSACWLL